MRNPGLLFMLALGLSAGTLGATDPSSLDITSVAVSGDQNENTELQARNPMILAAVMGITPWGVLTFLLTQIEKIVQTVGKEKPTSPSRLAYVRIWAGMKAPGQAFINANKSSVFDEKEGNQLGGHKLAIQVLNQFGKRMCNIENNLDKRIPAGQWKQTTCDYTKDDAPGQPHYLNLMMHKDSDPVCIAMAEVQYPGGTLSFTWSGDIARVCDYPWYMSKAIVSSEPKIYRPYCAVLNYDITQGMNIYLPGFHSAGSDKPFENMTNRHTSRLMHNPRRLCNSDARFAMFDKWGIAGKESKCAGPIFHPYMELSDETEFEQEIWTNRPTPEQDVSWVKPVTAHKGHDARPVPYKGQRQFPWFPKPRKERELASIFDAGIEAEVQAEMRRRHETWAGDLVRLGADSDRRDTAYELCTSISSTGPDFLSLADGEFCEMAEKRLWPVCSADVTTDCFDVELLRLRREINGVTVEGERVYGSVDDWDS